MDQKLILSLCGVLILVVRIQAQQQNQQNLQPEFRQLNQPTRFQIQQQQQRQAAQQQQQQQQQNFQQRQQNFQQQNQNFNQVQQQPRQQQQQFQGAQPNNGDVNNFATFNGGQREALPTLPPVFIPPNSPQGPPPQLQSPIRNLFRRPQQDNSFSLSNIINRFFSIFNLGSN